MHKLTSARRWSLAIGAARTLAVLMLTAIAAAPANAGLVTYDIDFSADSFVSAFGDPVPVDPVTGSVTLTFDPTTVVTDSTANITLHSLNIALGSAISFSYGYDVTNPDRLAIGGLHFGANVIQYSPSTDDFWLFIDNLTTAPSFAQLGYTQTSVSSTNLFYTLNQTGSVVVTSTPAAVPEPSTLALASIGILVGLRYGRRRGKVAHTEPV